ncbi:down syndrome cell adhesion molecule-like protein Dscam2 [Caerostris extrusa]|uniref:Down syndrome cell adhesion molecule-like protein Dscam2 n=1 Tax=Caerostris extrusa TaxID=172846 RepID=A0AAV4WXX4_CAEEX|nr:down syndrome cell adhesion molecule-like protein Dscam2 [Caerostris extrusa]
MKKKTWLNSRKLEETKESNMLSQLSTAGDFTYVHSSPRAHRYNNGTLVLSDVEENDSGSYLCQASNGIGAGLSKIITLKVLAILSPLSGQFRLWTV